MKVHLDKSDNIFCSVVELLRLGRRLQVEKI